jgi:CelD/BcsL family acetyltransferase involved in cellulose biosynthesis
MNNRFEAWRTGFDLSYFEVSVGKLMLMFLLEDCFRRGYKEADFLRGDEGYKEHWQPRHRHFYTKIRVISPRHLAAMFAFVWIPNLNGRIRPLMVRLFGPTLSHAKTGKVGSRDGNRSKGG